MKPLVYLSMIVTGVGNTLGSAFVLFKFWSWLVLPQFPDAPAISYAGSIGLMLVVNTLQMETSVALSRLQLRLKKEDEPFYTDAVWSAVKLLAWPTLLLAGWLYHTVLL